MVQLDILRGKKAGTGWVARRFPFSVGRSNQDSLALDDEGVWPGHFQLQVNPQEGILLQTAPETLTVINGQATKRVSLRNGDIIEIGSVKLRFSLSATRQSGLRFRETMTWIALGLLCLGQIGLIYWLAQ